MNLNANIPKYKFSNIKCLCSFNEKKRLEGFLHQWESLEGEKVVILQKNLKF